jgi:hypothetical protein
MGPDSLPTCGECRTHVDTRGRKSLTEITRTSFRKGDVENPTRTAHAMSAAIGLLANFGLYRTTDASSKFRRGLRGGSLLGSP